MRTLILTIFKFQIDEEVAKLLALKAQIQDGSTPKHFVLKTPKVILLAQCADQFLKPQHSIPNSHNPFTINFPISDLTIKSNKWSHAMVYGYFL